MQHHNHVVAVGISGSITSVIQVCDLVANKILIQHIHDSYYLWHTAHIRDVKNEILAHGGSPNNAHIKAKISINNMIGMIEGAVRLSIRNNMSGICSKLFTQSRPRPLDVLQ